MIGVRWVLIGCALSASACSVALDFSDECSVDADCDKGERGCRCDDGFCVAKPILDATAHCERFFGEDPQATDRDRLIVLGSLLPIGDGSDQGARLAVKQINDTGGIAGKKLSMIACDDGDDSDQGRAATRHLIDVAKVDAIIGAGSSQVTIDTFTELALPNRVLMISPSATSPTLTDRPDNGLLWRTAPSDVFQGKTIAHYLVTRGYKKIALVARSDNYGDGMRRVVHDELCALNFEGCTNNDFLEEFAYTTDPNGQPEDFTRAIAVLDGMQPDVVVLVSFVTDGVDFINAATGHGYTYVFADGFRDPEAVHVSDAAHPHPVVTTPTELCGAVGTNPGVTDLYGGFAADFRAIFGSDPKTYAPHAYDATYLVAYAYVGAFGAGTQPADIDGRVLAEQLKRLTGGATAINVGTGGLGQAEGILSANGSSSINLRGISSELDFDAASGEAPANIEMWRFDLGRNEISNLGVVFDKEGVYDFKDVESSSTTPPCH